MRLLVSRTLAGAAIALATAAGAHGQIVGPSTGGAAVLAQAERMLGHTKRVLLVAAHPDDEDTELLTYLVRREGAVSAYLSLTRGEGGQNLIGPELGEALGVIRTEELLAARALDGARQYFTRAFDFGYSKSMAETFRYWPRDSVLKDVVRVVRRFRPQVMVSIFSGTPRDGHGQHQVAGWAAQEAFRVAGDSTRFPELARDEGLASWTPVKLYRSARFDTTGAKLTLNGGLLDREVGQSYRQIAMRGRSLHRSQDMGVLQEVGPSPIRLALLEDRAGQGAMMFDGIDTTARADGVEAKDLEPYRATVAAGRAGLVVDAIADAAKLVAGMTVGLRLSAWNAGTAPARVRVGLAVPPGLTLRGACLDREVSIEPGAVHHCPVSLTVGQTVSTTEPYFLAEPRNGAWYRWSGPPSTWGEPFDPPLLSAVFAITTDREAFTLGREVFHRLRDQAIGEVRRPLAVVPRVDTRATPSIKVWSIRETGPQPLSVVLQHAGRDSTTGTVVLDLPPGWPAVPPQPFRFVRPDERRGFTFQVRPPATLAPGQYPIRAFARDQSGQRFDGGDVVVSYPHIRERRFRVPSTVTIRAASVALPKQRRIGYVRGAADLVPEALAGVGLFVEVLDPNALEHGNLSRYDVIVIGSRAYETDQALVENNGRLLDYARLGGHLVVQYQQQPFFDGHFAPYPLTVGQPHDRVSEETAPIRILKPNDQIFRAPNRIEAPDWRDWVQERGLYFASTWDRQYTTLLETHDGGEAPLQGGLLLARYGKGTYLYTGLAFFRQLPAGVPGAFRLFMNLLDVEPRTVVP
jgi:LmbE family N-acetylglucosaminyl deacetylase